MLKKIGTAARIQIERMLGTKVFLELYVKAQPGWRDSRTFVEELDWRRQLEHRMFAQRGEGNSQQDTENAALGDNND
jgi:GTP-binding protein Era